MTATERPGSRIAGMGALLRSLRSLRRRVGRFGEHRASTPDEQQWAGRLFDELGAAFDQATQTPAARGSLIARDRRAAISQKRRPSP